jgi:hypothetical protein
MGRRHLSGPEAVAALRRGRQIEQWLGADQLADGTLALSWLTAYQAGATFKLARHRVHHAGTDDFFDVSALPPMDDEEEFGEGTDVAEDPDPGRLLDRAASQGARYDGWVNQGIVQDEYRDSRSDRSSGS